MLKTILLALISINIFALEISLQGAKESHEAYSTFHLKDEDKFLCQEVMNDFEAVEKIVCAFSKSPSKELNKIQNSFFEITTQVKKKTFFLIIKPFHKIKLYPMIFDLTKEETVFNAHVELSRHWMIVGYKEKLPYIKEQSKSDVSINFPFTLDKDSYPYVGSLDIKGNPVHVKRVGDVTEYIKIKKLYKDKKYDFCLDLINEIMHKYPNSLFTAELLFYKIRVYSKLKNYENVIKESKTYLREYSSDENVPEVLSLVAKAYYKAGLTSDADYFFDRLFSEHPDSLYTQWGYVYKAEMLISSGSSTKARELLRKAIKMTADIDVAVEAAYRLAQNLIANVKVKDAAEYIEKIVKAKPGYFQENMTKSMGMMYEFVDNADYETGASIAQAILDEINTNYDEYEEMLRDIGIWLSQTPKKQEALVALNRYLNEFEGGMYEQEVQVAKDSLFFDVTDANFTTKLTNYDLLIEEYSGDSIGNKAIYEKAKLLIKNEKFVDALDLEEKLLSLEGEEQYKDVNQLITDAAIGTMQQALEAKECNSVLVVSSKYKIELSDEWDDGIYECAMKGADFELARKIADKNIKSKDLLQRKKWLYRYIRLDFATGNYSEVLEASKDLISLMEDDKDSPYLDVYRYIFDTYKRLENRDKLIDAIVDIERVYKLDYTDIDRYISVMALGSDKKDTNIVIEYGEKVMNIQKASDSYAQSPFVEFALYQAYIDREDNNKALEVIKSLDNLPLDASVRSRQKYLLGSVLDKLWRGDDAQKAYQESIDADKDSAWAELARGAKEI